MPRPYTFSNAVGIDVNYLADSDGTTFILLNMVDTGTRYQIEAVLREGRGTPTSLRCLDTMMQTWISWGAYPKEIVADRGLNNRGIFATELSAGGVYCSNI
eukprot:12430305-Karenia_brevis.AAC.1